ncbi:type I-D CRISPR-associated protein Cas5/Csc1 [Leptolyngbya sp. NK1-12]|uniref:Type I-D CRISPR-associated protein Cas5/Csc1 n=1 Tax=Leptolyngbya sp. NK1-12 TaxID=2547451 RepID=A0AA96WQY8_9CYAN|nr:type I-D CRISPR-associated protein Cas5/Csc1 [Leptolyngbya sp. NK1-12]WNZ27816.1 type I-D CRISPR-associated protein Cas5/Csc1 [Leptolyngbya sp. NK1-12]
MPQIYRCTLELHDSLYFATREIGRLYETEPILHNYALAYVLGLVDNPQLNTAVVEHPYCYFCAEQVPQYKAHLIPLNQQGIYVTPGWAVHYTTTLNTWKYADNCYHVEMKQTERNIPSFGRTKEIAPESLFEFFVITEKSLSLPRWVRIGKWASKAKLEATLLPIPQQHQAREINVSFPLNPLDVMFTNQILSYDTVNMPPVSLIRNVRMVGEFYTFEGLDLKLPAQMQYRFG